MVKARNADGVWSKDTQLVAFELVPSFWQTLWFKIACLLAFALIVFAVARIRLVQVKRQNVILEHKVQERTVELKKAHSRIVQLEKETTEKQMAGGFAHEIRNSLVAAKMVMKHILFPDHSRVDAHSLALRNSERLLELFKLAKAERDPEAVRQMAGIVKQIHNDEKSMDSLSHKALQSIERSLEVTTTILDYSKLAAAPTEDTPIDLSDLFKQLIDDRRQELEERSIAVEQEFDSGVFVRGTAGHYHSIFNNLVLNAVDALIDEGRMDKSPRRLRITAKAAEGAVLVAIWDNGVGIPEANLKRIFEPFFSTKPATGTGLGLGKVTKLLSLYGGELWVKSKEGLWTEFAVSIPVRTVA
jgi:signal transduction histidine kinase